MNIIRYESDLNLDKAAVYKHLCEANLNIMKLKKEMNIKEFKYVLDRCYRFLNRVEDRSDYVLFLVLNDKGEILGSCLINTSGMIDEKLCLMNMFYIDPRYRNQGLGRELYYKITEYCKELNYNHIFLSHLEDINDDRLNKYFLQFNNINAVSLYIGFDE